jgi:type II secretory pathway pseudopilin PulG
VKRPRLTAPGPAFRQWAAIVAVLLVVAAVLWRVEVQDARVDALAAALGDEQSAIEERGDEPVAPAPEDLLDDPADYVGPSGPTGPPGPAGPAGPALTGEQIEAAFAAYFADHPYTFEPSAAELTAAFAAVLADHPDLLYEQLYAAMADYLAANPPPPGPAGADGADGQDGADGEDGADGAQGEPGRPPTEEEIRTQIEAYIAEHGLPMCPEGSSPGPLTPLTTDGPVEIVGCIVQE